MANIHTPIPNLKLNDGNSVPMVCVAKCSSNARTLMMR